MSSWRSSAESRPISKVELSPLAASHIRQGRAWWRANRDKAPDAFDEEIERLLSDLETVPLLVGNPGQGLVGLRRVYLKRIRFYTYFQVLDDGERVRLLAVWHASRGSEPKL